MLYKLHMLFWQGIATLTTSKAIVANVFSVHSPCSHNMYNIIYNMYTKIEGCVYVGM